MYIVSKKNKPVILEAMQLTLSMIRVSIFQYILYYFLKSVILSAWKYYLVKKAVFQCTVMYGLLMLSFC